jgi:hypothetical protein
LVQAVSGPEPLVLHLGEVFRIAFLDPSLALVLRHPGGFLGRRFRNGPQTFGFFLLPDLSGGGFPPSL